jgi:hypothetical protein
MVVVYQLAIRRASQIWKMIQHLLLVYATKCVMCSMKIRQNIKSFEFDDNCQWNKEWTKYNHTSPNIQDSCFAKWIWHRSNFEVVTYSHCSIIYCYWRACCGSQEQWKMSVAKFREWWYSEWICGCLAMCQDSMWQQVQQSFKCISFERMGRLSRQESMDQRIKIENCPCVTNLVTVHFWKRSKFEFY